MTVFIVLPSLAALVLLLSLGCFFMAFYAPRSKKPPKEEYPIPKGDIYEPFRGVMTQWMKEVRAMVHEDCSITSFDGLKLCGKYYACKPGAVTEIMFHGYRGSAERDLCGGVQRAFALGRNVLIVDQRTSGSSDGHVITFGIKESRDCLDWVDFAVRRFGPDVRIILTGISMGATTVLMAAGHELPKQVIGVLADCGFTSAKAIIHKVIRQLHLPPALLYPLVKLAARLWGGFDPEADSALAAMKRCTVPVIFIHGEADDFVPCSMSRENYETCITRKQLVTVPGAGHGLAYPVDPDRYLQVLGEFFGDHPDTAKKSANPEITA